MAGERVESIDQPSLLAEAYGAVGLDLPPDVLDHVRLAQDRAWEAATLRPDAADRIGLIRTPGDRLVLSVPANGTHAARSLLERAGLDGTFDGFVTSPSAS